MAEVRFRAAPGRRGSALNEFVVRRLHELMDHAPFAGDAVIIYKYSKTPLSPMSPRLAVGADVHIPGRYLCMFDTQVLVGTTPKGVRVELQSRRVNLEYLSEWLKEQLYKKAGVPRNSIRPSVKTIPVASR